MKKKYLVITLAFLFLIGCSNEVKEIKDSTLSSQQNQVDKPVMTFDDKYKLIYNNIQKDNSRDREELNAAESIFKSNFEKTKKNIDLNQEIQVIPLSYSISTNQNGSFLMFNIFVFNTSDKTIVDFHTNVNYSFLNNSFTDSHTLELRETELQKIKSNEGVVISYGSDITGEPSEYFSNLNLEDVTIKLTDLTVTTE
ncbi:hypothetical protein [Carnobacterium maltaromaticum]|uniref:hypothetical protein n=1 Tax=Carnobacterium maltaromaticum TaxID=2751 RepID=UPI0039BEC376